MSDDIPAWGVIAIASVICLIIGFICGWCCRRDYARYNEHRAIAQQTGRMTRELTRIV